MNLMFTPQGGRISVRVRLDSGGALILSVADTGVGIAQRDIPTVLDHFGQASGPRANDEGTGLGLPLVKSMAELHGATVGIKGQAGAGTTVSIYFPVERVVPGPGLLV